MAVDAIIATCKWCESTETFAGEDPEQQWAESGWFVYLKDDGREFCCVDCVVAAVAS